MRINGDEIEALSAFLDVSTEEFRATYTRDLDTGEVSLLERRQGDCVFYDRKDGCTVYPHRPTQCRTWPFWRATVSSHERWAEAAVECHGMNQGLLYDADRIVRMVGKDGTSGKV